MMTHKEYMTNSNFDKHREFYGQFVTPYMKDRVEMVVSIKQLAADLKGGDTHLNKTYSCSKVWDKLSMVGLMNAKIKELGGCTSISTGVCIIKEAARQLAEEYIANHK